MLETARLQMRPLSEKDAYNIYQLNSDPKVIKYSGEKIVKSFSEAISLITQDIIPQFQRYKLGRFAVILKETNELIGWCGIEKHNQDEFTLSFRFKKAYWGRGLASEAAYEQLRYFFNDLHFSKVFSYIVPENIGSLKVVQKLGMSFCGRGSNMMKYELNKENFK